MLLYFQVLYFSYYMNIDVNYEKYSRLDTHYPLVCKDENQQKNNSKNTFKKGKRFILFVIYEIMKNKNIINFKIFFLKKPINLIYFQLLYFSYYMKMEVNYDKDSRFNIHYLLTSMMKINSIIIGTPLFIDIVYRSTTLSPSHRLFQDNPTSVLRYTPF